MEFEFDKEMDALLRQAAQGETVFAVNNPKSEIQNPKSLHLDADEISLFAENALPKKLRENAVVHFADCDRCRGILSDLIEQNSENEIVSAKQIEVFAPNVPWYRKLFAFPNLAYALGALVVVFSGLIGFTVLQSVDKSQTAEVSQVSERQTGGKGMSSDGEAVSVERANSNMMMSNPMSNATMSNSAASSTAMMSNTSANSAARSFNANSAANASTVSNKSNSSVAAPPKEEPFSEQEAAKNAAADSALQGAPAPVSRLSEEKRQRAEEDKKVADTTDTTKSASPASPTKPNARSVSVDGAALSDADSLKAKKNAKAENAETTSVGGKSFKRAGNAWVDAAYKGQATTNITRGTNEYKKLDSGLRGIAENLGGTVTIVWKDKAYRIQ